MCVCVSCYVSFCCVLFVVTGVVVLLFVVIAVVSFGVMGDVVLLFVVIVVECVSMVGLCCIVGNVCGWRGYEREEKEGEREVD